MTTIRRPPGRIPMTATPEAAELIEIGARSRRWQGFSRGGVKGGRSGGGPNDLKPALVFILPASIGFVVFFVFPAIRGIYLSFTELLPAERREMDRAGQLHQAVQGSDLLEFAEGDRVLRGHQHRRADHRRPRSRPADGPRHQVDFLQGHHPVALLHRHRSSVALLWFWMLDAQLGIVNQFLEFIGLSGQSWFGNPNLVIPTVAMVNVWRYMGYTALLIYAGLQTIPQVAVRGGRRWTGQPASGVPAGSPCPCCGR